MKETFLKKPRRISEETAGELFEKNNLGRFQDRIAEVISKRNRRDFWRNYQLLKLFRAQKVSKSKKCKKTHRILIKVWENVNW